MESRTISHVPASHPELGRWLWALEDTRARTRSTVASLDQDALDWTCPGVDNSIGSLLYHIALIEFDYLYADILGVDYPPDGESLLPYPDRDEAGHLWVVMGVLLAQHLARLDTIRSQFLDRVTSLTPGELAAPRSRPEEGYTISPAWTLHHLMQHEAEHRGQITTALSLYATRHGRA